MTDQIIESGFEFQTPSAINWNAKTFKAFQVAKRKQFGDGTVLITGEEPLPSFDFIPTEDPCLDSLLGGFAESAGWPRGSFIEISGEESSGKTTLSYEALASFAKAFPDRGIAFIDKEGNFDAEYAAHLGVPVTSPRFVYCMPETGPEALTLLEQLTSTGMFSCIVLDSWAALGPPTSDDADATSDHQQIGWLAKAGAITLGKLATSWKRYDCTFIATNQLRVNLTAMGARGMITTGGWAMKFYPRLKLRLKGLPGDGKEDLRKVTIGKAQGAARAETEVEIAIKHGVGLDRIESLVVAGLSSKRIVAAGAWFKVPELDIVAQGRLNLVKELRENDAKRDALCELLNVATFIPRGTLHRKMKMVVEDEVMADDSK